MSRVAVITGGSRGLGRAAALALAEDGVDVVVTYRSGAEEARAVVAEIEAMGRQAAALQLDTTEHGSFADFAGTLRAELSEHFGRDGLDIVINNAGFDAPTRFGETDPDVLDSLYAVHVRGPILLTELLAPIISDGGRVLLTSSGLTRFVGLPIYAGYAAMKGAIEVYAKYAAKALGPRRITVNVIAPGATATDFAGGRLKGEEYRARIAEVSAFGRIGEPADIAGAIRALVSPSAGWVTAQRIEASGGQSL